MSDHNTPDKALFEDHYYSDKAPATACLAYPGFLLGMWISRHLGFAPEAKSTWLISSWTATAIGIAPLAAAGNVAMYRLVLLLTCRARVACLAALAMAFGAAPLPYSTLLLSHAISVGLVAIALYLGVARSYYAQCVPFRCRWAVGSGADKSLECQPIQSGGAAADWWYRNRLDVLAGHACGWAVAGEYTAGIVVVGLFLWCMAMEWKRIIPLCLGACPPLLLIPAYNVVCFGEWFTLPYSLNASFPEMRDGLYAIKWPNPLIAAKLLFSPERGLFFWSPFLILSFYGWRQLFVRRPALFWLVYGVCCAQVLVLSGRTWDWQAGPTLGARYLSPIVPFLVVCFAYVVRQRLTVSIVLAVWAIAVTTIATVTNACPSAAIHNPLLELHIPSLLSGSISPNLGKDVFGLSAHWSVAVFYAMLLGGSALVWRLAGQADREAQNRPLMNTAAR